MRKSTVLAYVAAASLLLPAARPAWAETLNSVNLGAGGGQLMKHCEAGVYLAEYERVLGARTTVVARATRVNYTFDDGRYRESGQPRGLDAGLRLYPSGVMKGFFAGASIGRWWWDWRFIDDKGRSSESRGDAELKAFRVNLEFGARIPLGPSSISLMPVVNVGKYLSSQSCDYTAPPSRVGTDCTLTSEVKAYVFWSVLAGIAF